MNRPSSTQAASTVGKVNLQYVEGLPEDCWDEPVVSDFPTDLDRLQGAWVSVSDRHRIEFLISGNRFTVHFAGGPIYMGTFELDPAVRPKTMLVNIEEGQPHHKGQKATCIYELDGDHLRWCTPGPGSAERLSGFPAEQDVRYLCVLFRRECPRTDLSSY